MITFNDFECYVAHYTKNPQRKKFMENIFKAENITDVNWIEKFDREELSYMEVEQQFKMNIKVMYERPLRVFSPALYPLKPAEISLCLKHKESMRHFINESNKHYMFMMEDDAMLQENFKENFNYYMKSLPDDWDVCFIGSGGGKRIPTQNIIPNVNWYRKSYPAERCTDSILFKKEAVTKLYDLMNKYKISYPIDHELDFWMKITNLNVYWLEPPMVTQGSQCGIFDTFQDEISGKFIDKNLPVRKDLNLILEH